MRTLGRTAVALGFVGAMAIGTTVPVMAQGFYLNAPGVHIGVGHPYHRHCALYRCSQRSPQKENPTGFQVVRR
jgi:hypothetical protein